MNNQISVNVVVERMGRKIGVMLTPVVSDSGAVGIDVETFLHELYQDFSTKGGRYAFGVDEATGDWAIADHEEKLVVSHPLSEKDRNDILRSFEVNDAKITLLSIVNKNPEHGLTFWANLPPVTLVGELVEIKAA